MKTETTGSAAPARVDPRAPRFGQAVTATLTLSGVVLGVPALVYAVAAVLGTAVASGWRLDLYAVLWRRVAIPIVGPTSERESAMPHRFARLLGAIGTGLASLLLLLGVVVPGATAAGFATAGVVGALAALGALTGFCLGCRLYGQVAFFRRLGIL
jgi:hypothetical protein